MLFHARTYPSSEASAIAYQALDRTVSRTIGIGACILVHGELFGRDVVILGVSEDEPHERIRSGHWIGGEPFTLPADVAEALERRFERTREETGGARHEGRYGAGGAALRRDGGVDPAAA